VRCVVGTLDDRRSPGGIDARIADTLGVLKRVRSRVMDAGLKLAIENHAGDLQARELKRLVEDAGADLVGVCLDAGNAVWAIEDPHLTLETLAPYVLTSHTRDTAVWPVAEGAAVAWTRMGEGNVRIEQYLRAFIERCPNRTVMLEIIVVPEPRIMRYHTPDFWDAYRQMPAWEFERFLSHVAAGTPRPPDPEASTLEREVSDVEASLRWTKALLAKWELGIQN
jgi:3-oxoisoapionate decarboxylase